jgi:hypothetical protein
MKTKITAALFLTLSLSLTSCTTDTNVILQGQNLNSGDWLLVNVDNVKQTFKIIDDENILANNPTGIKVNWSEDHGYTTCDGILRLYKNGELVAQQEYLEQSYIRESSEIKAAYKNGSDTTVYPNDKADFERKWDSLKKIKNCYPTRYHAQPEDKDIIWLYKHE